MIYLFNRIYANIFLIFQISVYCKPNSLEKANIVKDNVIAGEDQNGNAS